MLTLRIKQLLLAAALMLAAIPAHALTAEQQTKATQLKADYLACMQTNSVGRTISDAYEKCWQAHDHWLQYQEEIGAPIALSREGQLRLWALKRMNSQ
jgi:hypothetical protein